MTKKEKLINWIVKNRFVLTLTIAIIIIMLSSLTLIVRGGNVYADDITFHTNRILGIADGLRGGQFPVKYYSNWYNGAGYFSPLFYGELFLYLPAILVLMCGGGAIKVAYYLFVYCIVFAIFISFYFLLRKFIKSGVWCIIGSAIFVLSQYIFLDIFYRGAIGESLAIIFIIWIFYGLFNLLKEDFSKPWLLSIAMLGLLFSHMTSLILCAFAIVLVVLFNAKTLFKKKSFWLKALLAVSIFLVIGAYQLMSFVEMYFSNTYVISRPWAHPLDYAHDFLDMFFCNIYGIGYLALVPFLLRPFIKRNSENEKEIKTINRFLIISTIILCISSSFFPWKYLQEYFMFLQFPWRLHTFTTVLLTITIILELKNLYNVKKIFAYLIISALAINFPIYNNLKLFYSSDYYFEYDPDATYEWLPVNVLNADNWPVEEIIYDEFGQQVDYTRKDHKIEITFTSDENSNFYELPVHFYKGYSAIITLADGSKRELNILQSDFGTITIETNGLAGEITLSYKGTTIQNLGLAISIIGVLCAIITPVTITIIKKRKTKSKLKEAIAN